MTSSRPTLQRLLSSGREVAWTASSDLLRRADLAIADASALAEFGLRDKRVRAFLEATGDQPVAAALSIAVTSLADTHTPSGTHPGTVISPAVTWAQQQQLSTDADLARRALIVGYEVCGRLGELARPQSPAAMRMTSIAGAAGAAAAIGTVLGLHLEQTASAMSFAIQAANGRNQWALEGTDDEIVHAGAALTAARDGIRYAESGFLGSATLLEGIRGFGLSSGHAVPTGRHPVILSLFHKRVQACLFAQSAAQAAREISAAHDGGDDPFPVTVRVAPWIAEYPGCNCNDPGLLASSQRRILSIQFAVAAELCRAVHWTGFIDPAQTDAIIGVATKIQLVSDPSLSGLQAVVSTAPGAVAVCKDPESMTLVELQDRAAAAQSEVSTPHVN